MQSASHTTALPEKTEETVKVSERRVPLDNLLDEALEEAFSASAPIALSSYD